MKQLFFILGVCLTVLVANDSTRAAFDGDSTFFVAYEEDESVPVKGINDQPGQENFFDLENTADFVTWVENLDTGDFIDTQITINDFETNAWDQIYVGIVGKLGIGDFTYYFSSDNPDYTFNAINEGGFTSGHQQLSAFLQNGPNARLSKGALNNYKKSMQTDGTSPGSFGGPIQNAGNFGAEVNLSGIGSTSSVSVGFYGGDLFTDFDDPDFDFAGQFPLLGEIDLWLDADGSLLLGLSEFLAAKAVARVGNEPVAAVDEGIQVTLDGSGSLGQAIDSYSWVQVSGEPVDLQNPDSDIATFIAPDVGLGGDTLSFRLTISDGQGGLDSTEVSLTVNFVNRSPVADAGPDQQVSEGEPGSRPTVILDGTASFDPDENGDDDIVDFVWRQSLSNPVQVILEPDVSPGIVRFTAPDVGVNGAELLFELTVTDKSGAEATDSVTVTVQFVNQPPRAEAGPIQNVLPGSMVTLDASASTADPPDSGDTIIAYSWRQSASDPILVDLIGANSATAEFTAPDTFSSVTLTFILAVTDQGDPVLADDISTEDTVKVNIIATNHPPVADAGPDQVIVLGEQPQTVILDGSGSFDPDVGDTVTRYAWQQIEGDLSVTLINPDSAQAGFEASAPDADSDVLVFELTVTDTDNLAASDMIAVTLLRNHPPGATSVNYPNDGSQVTTLQPVLSVNNAADDEKLDNNGDPLQILKYQFEVYEDLDLQDGPFNPQIDLIVTASPLPTVDEGVVEGSETTTSWQVDTLLNDNTGYFWRVRAWDGIAFGPWMVNANSDLARFFVNTANDPPTAPVPSAPADGGQVTTPRPRLEVTNAFDIDNGALTYEFQVYADALLETLVVENADPVAEGANGTTAWQVAVPLLENAEYWWRARAVDVQGQVGAWSAVATFKVNAQNSPPVLLPNIDPADGAEINDLSPTLRVEPATDADLDDIFYTFEIDTLDTFDSPDLQVSPLIAEAFWVPPQQLVDNTVYFWRVKAVDEFSAESSWVNGSFKVNRVNDPPAVPVLLSPEDNTSIGTLGPTLVLLPSLDPDGNTVLYDFELYEEPDRTNPIAHRSDTGKSWFITEIELQNNTRYAWRARAKDDQNDPDSSLSAWTDFFTFKTAANFFRPTAPALNSPFSVGVVNTLTPTLSVLNSEDGDGDPLVIEFEVYQDAELSDFVELFEVAQNEAGHITSVEFARPLDDQTMYFWRARAVDPAYKASAWMPTAAFMVDLQATAVIKANLLASVVVEPFEISSDPDRDPEVLIRNADGRMEASIDLSEGALDVPINFSIGVAVENVPFLTSGLVSQSKVYVFGPSGFQFDPPALIGLLHTASSCENLQVLTYNSNRMMWAADGIEVVECNENQIYARIDHFSLYTAASPDTSPGGSGDSSGGGGGCFVQTSTTFPSWIDSVWLIAAGLLALVFITAVAKGLRRPPL